MSAIDWSNVECEVNLFYAMSGHKPVGIGKHFQMLFVHEKFCQLTRKDVSSNCLWKHLDSFWDLEALDNSEISPFPNSRCTDFELQEDEFGEHILNRKKSSVSNDDMKLSPASKSPDDELPEGDNKDTEVWYRPAATGGKTGKGDWTPAKASPVPTNVFSKTKKTSTTDANNQHSNVTNATQGGNSKSTSLPSESSSNERKSSRESNLRRESLPSSDVEKKDRRSISSKETRSRVVEEQKKESGTLRRNVDATKRNEAESKPKRTSEVKAGTEKRTRTSSMITTEEKADSSKVVKRLSETRKLSSDLTATKRETPQRGGRSSRNASPTSSTGSRRNASPVTNSSRRNSSPSTSSSSKRTGSPASVKTNASPGNGNQTRKRSMRSDNINSTTNPKRSRR